ncbi:MAG: hypothetical protein PHC30_08065, partial [Lentisphaeria bacterium]|nr:hypothetical protein [Lentisphaeria bacterium]
MLKPLTPPSLCLSFALVIAGAAIAATPAPPPALHLRFDEGSGLIAQDSSGHGRHARLVNPQWEEFGVRGQALRLNGANALVELPDLDLRGGFTLSIWVKPEEFKHGMSLFNHGNYAVGWQTYFYRSFIAFSSLVMK